MRTLPHVSGTKKYTKTKAMRQNAAKKRYVPQVIVSSMSGVTRPMMLWVLGVGSRKILEGASTHKLHIHVVEVVMEIAFDLMARLKISEGRTHPIGARVVLLIHRVFADVVSGRNSPNEYEKLTS